VADTKVNDTAGGVDVSEGQWGPYYISTGASGKGVVAFIDGNDDPSVCRTTDGGVTTPWSKSVFENVRAMKLSAYFDQETPGDNGILAHVVWLDITGNDCHYRTVNIDDGSLGTQRLVDGAITVFDGKDRNRLAVTKTRNGNLLVAFSTQVEVKCYRSVDDGATWVARDDVFETGVQEDHVLLFPANTGDDADACALFWDRSANEITVKMYDDSATAGNQWKEKSTPIFTSMFDDVQHILMDGATRHSDGLILGVAHTAHDTAGDDLVTFTVNPNDITDPPVVTTTAKVFTDQAESGQCCIHINQQNNDVRIAHLKGNPTWNLTVDVVFHKSIDDMANWTDEGVYQQAATGDFRRVTAGRTTGNSGGFFQPLFVEDPGDDLFVNLVNDVAIAASVGGIIPQVMHHRKQIQVS